MMTRRPRFTVHTDDREWSEDSAPLLSFRLQNHDARGKTMSRGYTSTVKCGRSVVHPPWCVSTGAVVVRRAGVAFDPLNVSERRAGRSQFVS